ARVGSADRSALHSERWALDRTGPRRGRGGNVPLRPTLGVRRCARFVHDVAHRRAQRRDANTRSALNGRSHRRSARMSDPATTLDPLELSRIREHFPALERRVGGRQVVFADNASTSLKPKCVIDAVQHYYTDVCSNVHRGVSLLAEEADALYEAARAAIARLT